MYIVIDPCASFHTSNPAVSQAVDAPLEARRPARRARAIDGWRRRSRRRPRRVGAPVLLSTTHHLSSLAEFLCISCLQHDLSHRSGRSTPHDARPKAHVARKVPLPGALAARRRRLELLRAGDPLGHGDAHATHDDGASSQRDHRPRPDGHGRQEGPADHRVRSSECCFVVVLVLHHHSRARPLLVGRIGGKICLTYSFTYSRTVTNPKNS